MIIRHEHCCKVMNCVEPNNFWKRLWLLLVVYNTIDAKSGDSFSHGKKTILLGYSVKQAGHFRHLTSVLPMEYRLVNFFFKGSQDNFSELARRNSPLNSILNCVKLDLPTRTLICAYTANTYVWFWLVSYITYRQEVDIFKWKLIC